MDLSASFTAQAQSLMCTLQGHENSKIQTLCFEETCPLSSRASCIKCLKSHIKHCGKLILIEDVENFIKGLTGQTTSQQVQEFKEFKKNIVDMLNSIEGFIVKNYWKAQTFVDLQNRIQQEQSNVTLGQIAAIINQIANVDDCNFIYEQIEMKVVESISKCINEIHQKWDDIKENLLKGEQKLSESGQIQMIEQIESISQYQAQIHLLTSKNLELKVRNEELLKQVQQSNDSNKTIQQNEFKDEDIKLFIIELQTQNQLYMQQLTQSQQHNQQQNPDQDSQISQLTAMISKLTQQIDDNEQKKRQQIKKEQAQQFYQNVQQNIGILTTQLQNSIQINSKNNEKLQQNEIKGDPQLDCQTSQLTALISKLTQQIESNEHMRRQQIEQLQEQQQQQQQQQQSDQLNIDTLTMQIKNLIQTNNRNHEKLQQNQLKGEDIKPLIKDLKKQNSLHNQQQNMQILELSKMLNNFIQQLAVNEINVKKRHSLTGNEPKFNQIQKKQHRHLQQDNQILECPKQLKATPEELNLLAHVFNYLIYLFKEATLSNEQQSQTINYNPEEVDLQPFAKICSENESIQILE